MAMRRMVDRRRERERKRESGRGESRCEMTHNTQSTAHNNGVVERRRGTRGATDSLADGDAKDGGRQERESFVSGKTDGITARTEPAPSNGRQELSGPPRRGAPPPHRGQRIETRTPSKSHRRVEGGNPARLRRATPHPHLAALKSAHSSSRARLASKPGVTGQARRQDHSRH